VKDQEGINENKEDSMIFAVVFVMIVTVSLIFVSLAATKANAQQQAKSAPVQISQPVRQ
jgi:hypothetical protein